MRRISAASSGRQGWSKAACGDGGHRRFGHPRRAVHHPRLAQRQPLPELPAAAVEVAHELVQRGRQGAAPAGGTQPGVDLVEPAVAALAAGGLDDPLRQLAEEVLVGGDLLGGDVGHGLPVGLVEEDHVQVAVVVHFPPAELAQRQDGHFAGAHVLVTLRVTGSSRGA